MGWMAIWWVFGAVIVAMIVWALLRSGGGVADARESPEQILKRRYARGEIDRETYERMMADLKG